MQFACALLTPCPTAPSTKRSRCASISGADLLAHGAAQHVGFAERIAGQLLRDLHHLFLVDDDAVGLAPGSARSSGGSSRDLLLPCLRAL